MADELGLLMQFAAVPLLMLHRTGMVWYVRRSMFAASGLRDSDPPPDRKTPRREAAAVPQFQVSGPTTSPDWEASREAQVAIKLRPLRYRAIAGLMAAGLYAGLPPLLGLLDERVDQAVWEKLAQVAYVQLVLVAISYFINRRSFQARDATWTASWPQARMLKIALTKVLAPPWNVLLWLVIAAGAFDAVIGDASPMALQTYRDAQRPAFLVGVALAVLIHLALVVRGWCVHDLGPNPKLLVLRVFGAPKASALVFDKLADTWTRYGTYLTIDDPGYAGHRYRFFQISTLISWLMATLLGMGSLWLSLAFLGAVVASDWHGLLRRGPARSRAHARSRIERVLARPWVLDGAYSDLRTVAYMDLWKGVVQVFVEASDAVVFDLRGYNDERGGSAWEVGYLFDTLPVQRIVFVRHASDAAAIEALLLRTWRTMWNASPNVALTDPTIQVVELRDDDSVGARALMDRLLFVATSIGR